MVARGVALLLCSCATPDGRFHARGDFVATAWGEPLVNAFTGEPFQGPYDPNLAWKSLGASASDTVADIGCGYGVHVRRLRAQLGSDGRVLGRDVSATAIEKAIAKGVPKGCNFQQSEYADVMIDAATLGKAFMSQTWGGIPHQETRVELFISLRKALKPGGEFLVVQYPSHPHESQREPFQTGLEDAARAAGFECGRRWQLWDPESTRGPSWVFEFRRPLKLFIAGTHKASD